MRAIIHLGTYKTGTSSLQNALYDNREMLIQNGILYPKTGLILDRKVGFRHRKLMDDYRAGKGRETLQKLIGEFKECRANTLFLSTEAWSATRNFNALSEMVEDLRKYGFYNVGGVIVLRNLAAYQVSHYREFTVNRQNTLDYRSYCKKNRMEFDYLLKLKIYKEIFGNSLSVLKYEDTKDVRETILQTVGLGNYLEKMNMGLGSNIKSIDALDVEAIRCSRIHGGDGQSGLTFSRNLKSSGKIPADAIWTERFEGDVERFDQSYRQKLCEISGWSAEKVDQLLDDEPIRGTPVWPVHVEITSMMRPRNKRSLLSKGAVSIIRIRRFLQRVFTS